MTDLGGDLSRRTSVAHLTPAKNGPRSAAPGPASLVAQDGSNWQSRLPIPMFCTPASPLSNAARFSAFGAPITPWDAKPSGLKFPNRLRPGIFFTLMSSSWIQKIPQSFFSERQHFGIRARHLDRCHRDHARGHAYSAWAGARLISGNDGGVWSSVDGADTWVNHNSNLSITQFYNGSLHPTDPELCFGRGAG
jgi:hypothetical protein